MKKKIRKLYEAGAQDRRRRNWGWGVGGYVCPVPRESSELRQGRRGGPLSAGKLGEDRQLRPLLDAEDLLSWFKKHDLKFFKLL